MSSNLRRGISYRLPALAVSLMALTVVSCSGKPKDKPGAVELHGAGATFPAVLYDEWFTKYDKDHDELSIRYEAAGSGEGVRHFLAGEVDFAASDNGLTDEEVKKVSRGVLQ